MIKFRDNNIIVIGDTHGLHVLEKVLDDVPNHTDVVHIGDVGVGFFIHRRDDVDTLARIGKKVAAKGCRVYAIRGNHDNPDFWGERYDGLHLVSDYTYGEFPNGKRALFVGGGISVDRLYRGTRKDGGADYWVNELTPSPPKGLDKCSVVFAHDAPGYVNLTTESLKSGMWATTCLTDKTLLDESQAQRDRMSEVASLVEADCWVYGHYHNDLTLDVQRPWALMKTRCVNICRIKRFDADKVDIVEVLN